MILNQNLLLLASGVCLLPASAIAVSYGGADPGAYKVAPMVQTVILPAGIEMSDPPIMRLAAAENVESVSTVITDSSINPGTDTVETVDVKTDDDSDLFGLEGGYVHPFIGFSAEYTDNLFNVAEEETTSWIGKVSPGIWMALPRTTQPTVSISPYNDSPGGLQYQMRDVEAANRFQAYALGGLTYEAYSEASEYDDYNARLEGLFRYNMGFGLSLQALDRYSYDQDRFEIATAVKKKEYEYAEGRFAGENDSDIDEDENVRRYESNLFMATIDWNITEKFRAKGDFSNFVVDYESEINDYLDRTDNSAELYGYFNYSPKTSFLVEYRFIDVGYENEPEEGRINRDNEQNYWYGGINWASTEKLVFGFKAGSQSRRYEDEELALENDWDGFVMEFQSIYRWTQKTEFTFDFYRRSEESESAVALDKVTLGMAFGYRQKFTEKLHGILEFRYEDSDYNQLIDEIVSEEELDRKDSRYYFRPALNYYFRDWMVFQLSYSYDERDSTDDLFDYTTNTILFGVNMSM